MTLEEFQSTNWSKRNFVYTILFVWERKRFSQLEKPIKVIKVSFDYGVRTLTWPLEGINYAYLDLKPEYPSENIPYFIKPCGLTAVLSSINKYEPSGFEYIFTDYKQALSCLHNLKKNYAQRLSRTTKSEKAKITKLLSRTEDKIEELKKQAVLYKKELKKYKTV